MKILPAFLLILVAYCTPIFAQKSFYGQRWNKVYKFEVKSLPRSALEIVDEIYSRAKQDKNLEQLTKALLYQSKFALTQPDAELLIVQKWKKEIESSEAPLRNILESHLAKAYRDYFQKNSMKNHGRSRTKETVNAIDFRTWDADGMSSEISRHYQNSLLNSKILQEASLASINELLIEAEHSKFYRPTLFDFLAHEAIDFYSIDDFWLTRSTPDFELKDSKYFTEFESIDLADSLSLTILALKVFQSLHAFHKTDNDPTAFVQLELERFKFLLEKGFFTNETELHKSALVKLKAEYQSHPSSTLVDFEYANLLYQQGEAYKPKTATENQFKKKEALMICEDAIKKFPKSDGALNCKELQKHILTQSLSLKTEIYLPIQTYSRILVEYTNVDSLQFSAYKVSDEFLNWFDDSMDDSVRLELKKIATEVSWKVGLTNLHDYQQHSTEVIVPKLSNGKYILVAQIIPFSDSSDDMYAYASVQVTNLALIETSSPEKNRYQLVDRNTGQPLEGVDIQLKTMDPDNNYGSYYASIDEHFTTDKNGFIEVKRAKKRTTRFSAIIKTQNDRAVFGEYAVYQDYGREEDEDLEITARATLFTDRNIYRPGQTVHFKGILMKTKDKKSSVVPDEYLEVYLEDVTGQELSRLRIKTNSYGSVSGEFKLSSSGLTGEYRLYAEEDSKDERKFYENLDDFEYSHITFSVEEYKRPTFEATFNPLKETFALNDSVVVRGTANAFSGAKVGGAKMSYHVKRTVRYPHWYYWSYREEYSEEEEIALGEGGTDKDGGFSIRFKAVPDEEVSKDDFPIFRYEVTVDITDINGETRSATTTLNVGYHRMSATLEVHELINRKNPENSLSIATENLNGQPVASTGIIRIFRAKTSENPVRKRPWDAPDLPIISEEEFQKFFPNDTYQEHKNSTPENGKLMLEISFNTEHSKEVKWNADKSWELGKYMVELTTTDEAGTPVTGIGRFELVDRDDQSVVDNQLLMVELDRTSYKVGDVAKLKIGSASPNITITIDIETNDKTTKTYVEQFSSSVKEILIPITQEMKEYLILHAAAVNYNSFIHDIKRTPIVEDRELLEIENITFKDKLQPGAKETWSFEIKGTGKPKAEAELLASMYDASLDQFKQHEWRFDPMQQRDRSGTIKVNAHRSFGDVNFRSDIYFHSYYTAPRQYFDQFDRFGFSITNDYNVKMQYAERLYTSGKGKESQKIITRHDRKLARGYVSGTITDGDGSPLPGVNIVIKGTVKGTITDLQGKYMIKPNKGDVLVFSFIGYETVEVNVGKKNMINVIMAEATTQLNEVSISAYSVQARESLEMSASSLNLESLSTASDVNYSYKLSGKVTGVQVTGMPGGSANLSIRGISFNTGSKPLYVVDGMVVDSQTIDQADLANIQVLKGQAATALYGTRGANGVIIIITKSGQKKLDEEMAKVNARKNFNETAFFFPHLSTDESGKVRFTFTTPESLTRWKLQLLAHTKDLLTTTKTLQSVTQKELMVTSNTPRFLRMGDDLVFSVKISNLTGKEQTGNVSLQLSNAITGESADAELKNEVRNQPFNVSAKGTVEVSWKLSVPADIDAVQYKVVAKSKNFSDGEQNALPVLSNRMLVTETLPMYVRAGETKTFSLEKLKNTISATLQHHQLTLEVTSNPAWYAVQTLPYLMEFPHECAEQIFSRYYANILGSHIANSNPKIKAVFDQWASSGTLISDLEKNPELKSIILNETPWLRDAQSETEKKKRVALLFDLNTMHDQLSASVNKLKELQLNSGGFAWFSGGNYPNRYITQHIASSFGHLKQLNVKIDDEAVKIQNQAVVFLDEEILDDYNRLLKRANDIRLKAKTSQEGSKLFNDFMAQQHVYHNQVHYLYMRSFYPEIKIKEKTAPAVEYYQNQSAKYWQSFNLYLKGMTALIHHRLQNKLLPKDILQSLKENSVMSDELGMYWKENKSSWYWYESPIETQALLIEAFSEIEGIDALVENNKTIDDLRVWLLKNKQSSQWKTTKASTEAIYALLLCGTEWLTTENQVEVNVGGKNVTPDKAEAGTGYFKTSWKGGAITPAMSEVKVIKKDQGIAWAGLYWQYFEDLDKITSAETPLKLSKKVFIVNRDEKGEILREVNPTQAIDVGSLLRIRIELKADRPMEFLHMKDMRASGLEPVDVLSQHKWHEGLGYYQSIKDASMNFFFDSISPGIYVFEYDLRVGNKGNFSNGITTIQCMYAPEFSSHSEGTRISVR